MEDWFAHWFDEDYLALYAHRDEAEAESAVAMALRMAPGLSEGPVLDLACGNGRHLVELRRSNAEAFGLDLSAHLLAMAPAGLKPYLLRGDMRRLPLKQGSLTGITLWFTPFGYFDDHENALLLRSLGILLRPGGILLLDYLNAHHVHSHLLPDEELEIEGCRVRIKRFMEGKRLVKGIRMERLHSGAVREVRESLRLYDPDELRAMIRSAGLSLASEAGAYDGSRFQSGHSHRWIGFCTKG
jgi:SAM-dependent methyltransferase